MTKLYRKISICLVGVLFLLSTSGYIFYYAHGWLANVVTDKIDDVVLLVEYGKIEQAGSLIETLDFIPTSKINAEKINLQKAIIQSKIGKAKSANEFFKQSGIMIDQSEIGQYYQYLIELILNSDKEFNQEFLMYYSGYSKEGFYENLTKEQKKTAYRELILAQVLIDISEKNLAVFTLKQAIKKSPDYRDAYILLFSITGDEGLLNKINIIDPGYRYQN